MLIQRNSPNFLAKIPHQPGVYQMQDKSGKVLYVGKALDLRKRLANYFSGTVADLKARAFLEKVVAVEIIITANDTEAFLLESNLIKTLHPHYNILLKDDKSYPYLFLSRETFPVLRIHRGAKKIAGYYFGPFVGGGTLREILYFLQKIFKLRQCDASTFRNRTRPCLQYQIGRCSAPCVGYISAENYARNVEFVRDFFAGKSKVILRTIAQLMREAADNCAYEEAAFYRDQIAGLELLQEKQCIVRDVGDIDVIVVGEQSAHKICGLGVVSIRGGLVLANKNFVYEITEPLILQDILFTLILQYYAAQQEHNKTLPGDVPQIEQITGLPSVIVVGDILVDSGVSACITLQNALNKLLGVKLKVVRSIRKKVFEQWLELARSNLDLKMREYVASHAQASARFLELRKLLKLESMPVRIECFDVSHTGGDETVVSCVVFDERGAARREYRRFNVDPKVTAGDDCAALAFAVHKRYRAFAGKVGALTLLLIDGGRGQINAVNAVLKTLDIANVVVLGVAKDENRKVGNEKIYRVGERAPIDLDGSIPLLHFLLQIRDEAHRFAITGHRKKYAKKSIRSVLESIVGVGKTRRNALLSRFGGLQGIRAASCEEIAKVPGINAKLAKVIWDAVQKKD